MPRKNKKSQITIFVIIALIIVVAVALVYVLMKGAEFGVSPVKDPVGYIERCAGDATKEAVEKLLPHGGYIEPAEPNLLYKEEKVAYLCYTPENKRVCTNKEPMLVSRIEREIKAYISPKINDCFSSLEKELRKYNYKAGAMSIDIEIKPKQIIAQIKKDVSYTKSGADYKIENFDFIVSSPLYDFSALAIEIINQEVDCDCATETCNADVIGLSIENQDYEIERYVTGRNEKIYTIKEAVSGDEFVFAVRNCVRLP